MSTDDELAELRYMQCLYRQRATCQCGDDEACAHVRRAEAAEAAIQGWVHLCREYMDALDRTRRLYEMRERLRLASRGCGKEGHR